MRAPLAPTMLILTLGFAVQAHAGQWVIDPEHSEIGFAVTHLMVSDVKGAFESYQATVTVDDKDLLTAAVDVSIDTASVSTRSKRRDESLRGKDFFDVTKFPRMTFKTTRAEAGDKPNTFKVTGDLTIRDVTKAVVLQVEVSDEWRDPWSKRSHRGVKASTVIKRRDFGMNFNGAMDRGGVVVGEEVKIFIEADFVKKG